jgi:L,D-peptidoglycan transpeptidase YkuD (ErfK/YbiS/YcfS/YnhG family)
VQVTARARHTGWRLVVPLSLAPLLAGALFAGTLMTARPAHAAAARPARATAVATGTTRQLIKVTASSHSATYATFRAYRISGGKRVLAFGPWTARVGYNGIARPGRKREGDGRTPAGAFGFSFFFGTQPKLRFSFPFRHAYRYDYWDDQPASARYNTWVNIRHHSAGARPEPMHQVPAYDYAAVIAYNTARTPGRGSAIFLHVGTGSSTAGCVSLPRNHLISILRWLRPKNHPMIKISG